MNREEALKTVKEHVKNKNLIKHMLAVEGVMRRLAQHFGEDAERWALAGLLHDIDYDKTMDDPARHSLVGAEILKGLGLDDEIVHAVKTHNEYHGIPRESLMDKALYCSDPVTGLIVAAALIHPDKKLAPIDAKFVLKRFDEKAFARGANRETIQGCSELGISLEDFINLSIEAMKNISGEIGL